MKYLIAAGVAIVLLAAAFAGGYYARNSLSLFNADTVSKLREWGVHLARVLATAENGLRAYQSETQGDDRSIDNRTGYLDEERGLIAEAESLDRETGTAIERGLRTVEEAEKLNQRLAEILRDSTD